MIAAALSLFILRAEVFEMKARPTMTPVELNLGDVCRFTLAGGGVRTVEYAGGESSILEVPATEGLIATFTMRLKVDGVEIPFRRYLATQESFYEPAVVDGLRIFPDSTLEYLTNAVPMRYPSSGAMRHHPWKDCRVVLQDATLKLCPERLHPWFDDGRWKKLFIPIGDCYHGGDCWLGPFAYGQAHGGLDIRMKQGSLLYAPFAMDDQWMALYAKKGRGGNSRWRGVRRWSDGTLWSVNTSHVIDPVVAERTAVTNGQAYCTAAGTATGEYDHTHFELHICRDPNCEMPEWDAGWGECAEVKNDCPRGQPEFYNLDPWTLFWQTFVQLRDERGLPAAEIAPFGPAKTGERVRFRSARAVPEGRFAVWTFNDGTMHVGGEAEHVFATAGVYTVTLVVSDGRGERARDVALITVSGEPAAGPLPGAAADDVSFVELRPGDLPAWGELVRFDPHSVGRESELRFFDRAGGGRLEPTEVKREALPGGVVRVVYAAAGGGETVEALVRKRPGNPGRMRDAEFILAIGDADGYFHTPCFWVQHHFDCKRRWYETNGARRERGQFVRFQPRLRAGRWRIEETFYATHAPGASYVAKVRAKDGEHRVRVSPLKNRLIGEYDFDESEGWVQIDAEDSTGPVYVGALKFTPVKLLPPRYITAEREKELRAERESLIGEIRRLAKTAEFTPLSPPRPKDWLPAVRAVGNLQIGGSTAQILFQQLTETAEQWRTLPGGTEEWREFSGWLYTRCWHLGLKTRWDAILKKPTSPDAAPLSPLGARMKDLAGRLAAATDELQGVSQR
ncbi:MAG: PKD domain-containing protein [Kiritimatiellae bacterium]|nr:PKD domain-containing protein [Kiritimatiellia bacterium]